MPSITAPAKILITGVNGYVGAHVAKDLLERGFTVVGTVRSSSKGDDITRYFSQYGNRFSYMIVEDISGPEAFDKALSTGKFDGVAHVAAPTPVQSLADPSNAGALQAIFDAATEGTLNLLRSVKQHGHTVKRVVITSSSVAALQSEPGVKHTEGHWNEQSVQVIQEKGDTATHFEHYVASKYLSEKAAWKFMEDNKRKVNFDLVTILPNLVLGAPVNENTTRELLEPANIIFEGLKPDSAKYKIFETYVTIIHAKDVAALHSESFLQPRAAGHRVFGAVAEPSWQDVYDALNEEPAFPGVPKGQPGVGSKPNNESLDWDMSFARSLLGRDLIGAKETIREVAKFYQEKGWEFI
ncbi:D-lactaldehyde dehydrogenase [Rhizoctonia solani]|nr:D-lactaldehyde dehydrogenase [Rhizoctonia solani]